MVYAWCTYEYLWMTYGVRIVYVSCTDGVPMVYSMVYGWCTDRLQAVWNAR